MVYSMFDRIIAGGAVPVDEELVLEAPEVLRAEYFTQRREIGIINVGGAGVVKVGDEEYEIPYKEAIYVGRGNRHVAFHSIDPAKPAHFYFCSATAHKETGVKKVSKKDAVVMHLGSLEESNERTINRLLVKEVVPCCQLQMGMTELAPGSTWNTMPAHTHDRRMEVYFYFELPDPRRRVTSGCTTRRPSSPRSGASTPPAPPATTPSSGACAAKTTTTTTWTGAPPKT